VTPPVGEPPVGWFVDRTVYPAVPLHVEYELTPLGRGVAEPLGRLRAWVENHLDEIRSA
jgi:DNA-binding HxlR family transcriptional regulator